jgi:micrococcal nuclease
MEFIRIIFLARAIFSNYDGDTATVNGDHYRIVGMDAPEIHGKCPEERALALKAKAALNQYMNMLDAELAQVKCAGNKLRDKYGRFCAKILVNNESISPAMIERGLARTYTCIGKCPRRLSWCPTGNG